MIDKTTFAREMAILADRFSRTITPLMAERYYEYLNARMDTTQFEFAARTIYNEDRFWPAPTRFLEALHVDAASQAEDAWTTVLDAATRGDPYDPRLTPPMKAALARAGGWNTLAYTPDAYLTRVRNDFMKAYARAAQRETLGPARLPQPHRTDLISTDEDD